MLDNPLSKFQITIFAEIWKQYSIEQKNLGRSVVEKLIVCEIMKKFPGF